MQPYIILIGLGPFLIAAVLTVQILLSKNPSPLWGWIMPLLSLLLSLYFTFGSYRSLQDSLPRFAMWSIVTVCLIITFFIVRYFRKKGVWDPIEKEKKDTPPDDTTSAQ